MHRRAESCPKLLRYKGKQPNSCNQIRFVSFMRYGWLNHASAGSDLDSFDEITHLTFTYLKSPIETLEKSVKYFQI